MKLKESFNLLKVLQINKFLYPHQGGIESVSESIIEALEDTNLELFNICFSNNKDFPSRKNVKRFFSRFTFFSQPISLSYMLFIFRNLKKFDACIVHFPNVLALIALIFLKVIKSLFIGILTFISRILFYENFSILLKKSLLEEAIRLFLPQMPIALGQSTVLKMKNHYQYHTL